MLSSGRLKIAEDAHQYVHGIHDGVMHKEHLCLRADNLENKMRIAFPAVTKKDIANELLDKRALKRDTDGSNSKQISATGNKRFLWIPFSKLP